MLPFIHYLLAKGAAHLVQENEMARVSAAGDDHESEDEEGDPAEFNACLTLRKYFKNLKPSPAGGATPEHKLQLARSRERFLAFGIASRGQLPPSSEFLTKRDAERYFRPFLFPQAAAPAGAADDDAANSDNDGGGAGSDQADAAAANPDNDGGGAGSDQANDVAASSDNDGGGAGSDQANAAGGASDGNVEGDHNGVDDHSDEDDSDYECSDKSDEEDVELEEATDIDNGNDSDWSHDYCS